MASHLIEVQRCLLEIDFVRNGNGSWFGACALCEWMQEERGYRTGSVCTRPECE